MKKINFGIVAVVVLGAFLLAGTASAQSTQPSAAGLLAAVNALQTVDAARQSILGQINVQLAQVTEEAQNLANEPRNTPNEQAAFLAEIAAIAGKLNELSGATGALNQIQVAENSLFASLQANMQRLGL